MAYRGRRSSSLSPFRSPRRAPRRSLFRRTRLHLAIFLLVVTILLYYYHYVLSSTSSGLIKTALFPHLAHKSIPWSSFAYSSYATSTAYLCNSILLFESLHRYGSKADRVLFYPDDWDTHISGPSDRDSQLLVMARDKYNVKLMPVDMNAGDEEEEEGIGNTSPGGGLGSDVIRFLAWDQTQYERVIYLDSDITLQRHLDELFLLPKARIAMTRASWSSPLSPSSSTSDQLTDAVYRLHLSPRLIVIEPSRKFYLSLTAAAKPDQDHPIASDAQLYTSFFASTALILPHQIYGFPISELRASDHNSFFGPLDPAESSSFSQAVSSAAVLHFLDPPFPKPWIMWPREMLAEEMPICEGEESKGREACKSKDKWFAAYDNFRRARKEVCRILSEPAPEWKGGKGPKNQTGV